MKFLALLTLTPGTEIPQLGPHMVAELQSVWAGYKSGRLREIYFSPSPPVVTIMYEAADLTTVERDLAQLPMVDARLLAARIVPLGPMLQFEALFDKSLIAPT
jgi:hypothetical protein